MNELIKLQPQTINGNAVETVSARELHAFLQSKQDFSTWIKNRIADYDFVENQDFITDPQKYGTANGGYATRKEYYITLNMAKELAMEQNVDYVGFAIMANGNGMVEHADDQYDEKLRGLTRRSR